MHSGDTRALHASNGHPAALPLLLGTRRQPLRSYSSGGERDDGDVVAAELLLVHKNQIKPEWITDEIETTLAESNSVARGLRGQALYVVLFWTAL